MFCEPNLIKKERLNALNKNKREVVQQPLFCIPQKLTSTMTLL